MKLIRIHQQGPPEVMRLEDAPIPDTTPGMVRVKNEVAGVNFIDLYQRSGQNKVSLPFTPGMEGCGWVDAVGEGVKEVAVGQRVAHVFLLGTYAEYMLVPADRLIPVPDNVESEQVIPLLVQGMTAHYLTHDTFPLQKGQTALIHAAAGGTGQLLVQVAKRRGARVIGTVSNDHKAQLAREHGADEVIIYTRDDFEAETKRLTNGRGVDVVYDSVGKDTFDMSLNCLHPRGYMVLFGASSGAVPPFDPQTLNSKGSLFLTRPSLGHYIATREELLRRASDLFDWVAKGELRVHIDRTFPLAEAAAAHEMLAARQTTGKVLLVL
jgi:NADPH2:quinone reductase